MADRNRKAELEAKRERLRQMREEKERRKHEKEKQDTEEAAKSLNTRPAIQRTADPAKDIDAFLSDMGIASVKSVSPKCLHQLFLQAIIINAISVFRLSTLQPLCLKLPLRNRVPVLLLL